MNEIDNDNENEDVDMKDESIRCLNSNLSKTRNNQLETQQKRKKTRSSVITQVKQEPI